MQQVEGAVLGGATACPPRPLAAQGSGAGLLYALQKNASAVQSLDPSGKKRPACGSVCASHLQAMGIDPDGSRSNINTRNPHVRPAQALRLTLPPTPKPWRAPYAPAPACPLYPSPCTPRSRPTPYTLHPAPCTLDPQGYAKELRPGDWRCAACGAHPNFASRSACYKCGAPKPPRDAPMGGFGGGPMGGFGGGGGFSGGPMGGGWQMGQMGGGDFFGGQPMGGGPTGAPHMGGGAPPTGGGFRGGVTPGPSHLLSTNPQPPAIGCIPPPKFLPPPWTD